MNRNASISRLIALVIIGALAGFQAACSDDTNPNLQDKTSTFEQADSVSTDADNTSGDARDSAPDIAQQPDEFDTTEEPDTTQQPDATEEPDATQQPDEPDTTEDPVETCTTAITQRVFELVNASRAAEGHGPLSCDLGLTRAAQLHAEDMCNQNYFSHTSLDGRRFSDRIRAQGNYGTIAENIAAGRPTPEGVHDQWMNSSGHRRNIMNPVYRRMGVGFVACDTADYGYYWVETFAD